MQIKNILKQISIIGLFAIPFIPLIVGSEMYFPFITGKGFAFRTIVEIVLASWVLLAVFEPSYRPKFSWILGSFTIFLALMFVADAFGENFMKSMWSNYERMEGWILMLHLWAYFLVLTNIFKEEKWWLRMFNTTIIASLIITVYSYLQLFGAIGNYQGGAVRLDATIGNPSYLGVYMLIHIYLAGFLFLKSLGKGASGVWNKYTWPAVYGVIIIIEFIILLYTQTRGAWVGLAFGLIVASILVAILEKENKILKHGAIIILIITAVSVGGLYLAKDSGFVKDSRILNRAASVFDTKSAFSRSRIWGMALEGAKERPVLGWGQENFNYIFNKNYTPDMYNQESFFDRAHNVFMDWLVAGGVLGLIGYLALFFFAFWYIWKSKNHGLKVIEKALLTGMLVAYFIHNFFVFDHLVSYILFIIILAYIHDKSSLTKISWLEGKDGSKVNDKDIITYTVPVVIILLCFSLYNVVWKPLQANYALAGSLGEKTAEGRLNMLKKSLAYNSHFDQEIRETLLSSGPTIVKGIRDKDKSAEADKFIVGEIEKSIKYAPKDVRTYLFAATYYDGMGNLVEAENNLKKSLEYSPAKQGLMFNLGNVYFRQKKYEDMYLTFKKAYELDKSYDAAKSTYTMSAVLSGHTDEVYDMAKPIFMTENLDQNVVAIFTSSTSTMNSLLKLYERIKKDEPKSFAVRLGLVRVYMTLGSMQKDSFYANKQKALNELYNMKYLFPEQVTMTDVLIKQINEFKL